MAGITQKCSGALFPMCSLQKNNMNGSSDFEKITPAQKKPTLK